MTTNERLAEIKAQLAEVEVAWGLSLSEIDEVSDTLRSLVAALEAVLELHKPVPENNPFPDAPASPWCLECGWEVDHPCPTVEAVTKALH